jgi:hypothetical protein
VPKKIVGTEDATKALTSLRYSLPRLCMPKVSSISAAVWNRMMGLF